MKRIVICEGKTDAILVGYFLIKVYGWQFTRGDKLPALPFDKKNESLCWYSQPNRGGSELAVWGAGGITRVSEKLATAVNRTKADPIADTRFERFVILIDRDARSTDEARALVQGWCAAAGIALEGDLVLGDWAAASIQLEKKPPQAHPIRVLPIVLPPTQEGCLEVFLAEALRTVGDADKNIVDSCRELVSKIPDEPYLVEQRFRPKATVGAALSIMSPDWVFGDLDEKLTAIAWEEIQQASAAYSRLADL